ncbi:hypothetical protein BDW59DRAFT_72829 [Aspergillus cavernicola]|uniref:C2H2-type domain-containing protein n=1 Tax=Aspergillus cavernicola TaxID=176166 RepID=A0ABR4IF17_9EURO
MAHNTPYTNPSLVYYNASPQLLDTQNNPQLWLDSCNESVSSRDYSSVNSLYLGWHPSPSSRAIPNIPPSLSPSPLQVVQSVIDEHRDPQQHPHTSSPSKPVLECKWEGCTCTRHFTRESELLRHIRYIHLNPRQYTCPINLHCKPFNRKDNLREHMRRVHGAGN